MDNHGKLGNAPEIGALRDAIHVPIYPAIAGEDLEPGQHVYLNSKGTVTTNWTEDAMINVIVDPFLYYPVIKGKRVWVLLEPGTIQSLTHVWEHQFLPNENKTREKEEQEETKSEKWMREFAESFGFTKEKMLAEADNYIKTGEYFNDGPTFDGVEVPDEFWHHYELIRQRPLPLNLDGQFFSCAC
jgi:hypothetical protein